MQAWEHYRLAEEHLTDPTFNEKFRDKEMWRAAMARRPAS